MHVVHRVYCCLLFSKLLLRQLCGVCSFIACIMHALTYLLPAMRCDPKSSSLPTSLYCPLR